MKNIVGLDIGTNSIGWAYIQKAENENEESKICGMGTRIISIGEDKTNFEQGKGLTRNAKKREKKSSRKLNKRYKQRRNKLIYVLNALNILPDFINIDGVFPDADKLQKLNIKPIDKESKQLTAIELYELRKQALYKKIEDIKLESNPKRKITLKDFGRLIYLFNQLRGYAGGETADDEKEIKKETETDPEKESVKKEFETVIISFIEAKQKVEEIKKGKGNNKTIEEIPLYRIELIDTNNQRKYKGECYKEFLSGAELQVEIIKKSDEDLYPFFNIEDVERKKNTQKGGSSEIIRAKILSSEIPQEYFKKKPLFNLKLQDGREGILTLNKPDQIKLFKIGDEKELQITTITDENGSVSYQFSLPFKSSWRKEMEDLEKSIKENGDPHLGEYFYNKLKENKWYRVRNRVILRNRYKREFDAIWEQQAKHYPFLNNTDENTLKEISHYLFPGKSESQNKFRQEAISKGLKYIIKEQIIYFQRNLKPQFKLVGICQFETDPPIKVIPESHPLHQEKKIWEGINSLSINTVTQSNGMKIYDDNLLSSAEKEIVYVSLQEQKELSHSSIRSKLYLREKVDWLNGLNVKAKLKGNTTLITIKNSLNKIKENLFNEIGLDDSEKLTALWRILYNWIKKEYENVKINIPAYEDDPTKYHEYDINSDNEYDINSERCKAIRKFIEATNIELSDEQIKSIAKIRFKRVYSSLSAKAISNILSFLKTGKFFNAGEVAKIQTKKNYIEDNLEDLLDAIENGVSGVPFDGAFLERYRKGIIQKEMEEGGMKYSDAASLIYGKHTAKETTPEESAKDYHQIKTFFKRKQENPDDQNNYLRNPVVEQITDETLQLIYSIWKQYGQKPDEIRIELARELKNNAEQREKMYKGILEGEKINNYVRQRLIDLKRTLPSESTVEIERSEPSFANIEKYKLWRKQIKKENEPDGKEPDRKDIIKYRLWSEQHHISPYTHKPIPLSELFSKKYDVDHIIPKSRYFDDSLTNKVVCETIVNEDKGNRTPYEYLTASAISSEFGVKDWNAFQSHVNEIFIGAKRKNLLATEIPKDFVERQIKETQYVSIKVKEELGKIIGTKNVKTTTGGVTDNLRQQWGLNDKFKELTKSRYEAMAKIAIKEDMVRYEFDKQKNKKILKIDNWSKRHDHRHHAIDALVVACTEQSHVHQLNNLNKNFQSWFGEFDLFLKEDKIEQLQAVKELGAKEVLLSFSQIENEKRKTLSKEIFDSIINKQKNKIKQRGDWEKWFYAYYSLQLNEKRKIQETMPGFRRINQPWHEFYKDHQIENLIDAIIVSHKPNKKLLIQKDKNGNDVLRIRGALHKETLFGKGETKKIPLTDFATASEKTIEKILSEKIKWQIKKHLKETYKGSKKEAFSKEGIKTFNDYRERNGLHPVYSVKVKHTKEENEEETLQPLQRKNYPQNSLLVQTRNNYCFGIAEKDGKRKFGVLTFFDAVNLMKDKKNDLGEFTETVDEIVKKYFENECEATKESKLLFALSINDMVYLPKENEIILTNKSDENFDIFWKNIDRKRIYKVVKMGSAYCSFVPHTLASELEYRPLKIDNPATTINESEEDKEDEDKKTSSGKIKEYGEYGGCSPFVLDNTKKELLKKTDYILTTLKYLNPNDENKEQKEIELHTELVSLISNNTEINIIQAILKKDRELGLKIKSLITESKKDEIAKLIEEINNDVNNDDKRIEKISDIISQFKDYGVKNILIKKDKVIAKRVNDFLKNENKKVYKYKQIAIQDTCIKLNVDRIGNIIPDMISIEVLNTTKKWNAN